MASLTIVIGFDGPGSSARPSSVYVGRDGSAAEKAMASSDAVRFEVFKNPTGVRKAGRGVAVVAAPVAPVAPPPPPEDTPKGGKKSTKKDKGTPPAE